MYIPYYATSQKKLVFHLFRYLLIPAGNRRVRSATADKLLMDINSETTLYQR